MPSMISPAAPLNSAEFRTISLQLRPKFGRLGCRCVGNHPKSLWSGLISHTTLAFRRIVRRSRRVTFFGNRADSHPDFVRISPIKLVYLLRQRFLSRSFSGL